MSGRTIRDLSNLLCEEKLKKLLLRSLRKKKKCDLTSAQGVGSISETGRPFVFYLSHACVTQS